MKMKYYSQYAYKDGVYVGIGELIEVDTTSKKQNDAHIKRQRNMSKLAQHRMPNPAAIFPRTFEEVVETFGLGEGENVAVMNMAYNYGSLGRNDFEKDENGVYVCTKFHFDKDWFVKEVEKIQRLHAAFIHYVGYKRRKNETPKRFNEIQDRLSNLITTHIIDSQQNGIEPTKFTIDDFTEHFTKEEIEYKKKMSIRYNNGEWRKIVTVNEHKDKKSLDDFMTALNDCMDNVRASISAYSVHSGKIELRTDEYEPLNIFGAHVLHLLDMYKKDMSMIKCKKCGTETTMKNNGSHICESCQNAKRQRKKYIRASIKQGLTLDEILKKHSKMDSEEVKEHYNNIMAKDEK